MTLDQEYETGIAWIGLCPLIFCFSRLPFLECTWYKERLLGQPTS